jgi:hypothetical protein
MCKCADICCAALFVRPGVKKINHPEKDYCQNHHSVVLNASVKPKQQKVVVYAV